MEQEDDGSLEFLKIPRDEKNRSINCERINQRKLRDTTFWIVDMVDNIKTKYGEQMLIKIKFNLDDDESQARKFFTGSAEIRYVVSKIKEMNKFPRKVTLKGNDNNRYWLI